MKNTTSVNKTLVVTAWTYEDITVQKWTVYEIWMDWKEEKLYAVNRYRDSENILMSVKGKEMRFATYLLAEFVMRQVPKYVVLINKASDYITWGEIEKAKTILRRLFEMVIDERIKTLEKTFECAKEKILEWNKSLVWDLEEKK